MTRPELAWPLVVLASAGVATLVVAADLGPPLRPAAVLWFVLVCPGLAVVGAARLEDRLDRVVLAVATSLALAAAVSGALMYARWWSPPRVLAILVLVSAVGAGVELRAAVGAGRR